MFPCLFGNNFHYSIVSAAGVVVEQGTTGNNTGFHAFSFINKTAGVYFIILPEPQGVTYRVKVIKEED